MCYDFPFYVQRILLQLLSSSRVVESDPSRGEKQPRPYHLYKTH
jgi:hypothetical protein